MIAPQMLGGIRPSRPPRPQDEHHLGSCAGMYPGNEKSEGKRVRHPRTSGNRWLRVALTEAVLVARCAKNNYSGAAYRRLVPRRGKKRVLVAVDHRDMLQVLQSPTQLVTSPSRMRDPQCEDSLLHLSTRSTRRIRQTTRLIRQPRTPRGRVTRQPLVIRLPAMPNRRHNSLTLASSAEASITNSSRSGITDTSSQAMSFQRIASMTEMCHPCPRAPVTGVPCLSRSKLGHFNPSISPLSLRCGEKVLRPSLT